MLRTVFALYTDSFSNPPMQVLHGVETQPAQGHVPGKWSGVSGSRAHTLTRTLLDLYPCTPDRVDGKQQGEACSERRGAIFCHEVGQRRLHRSEVRLGLDEWGHLG